VKRFARRVVVIVIALVTIVLLPCAVAPAVSEDPVLWAYRVYHPRMYRYPEYLLVRAIRLTTRTKQRRSRLQTTIDVLRMNADFF
jgi:hypothetical protein